MAKILSLTAPLATPLVRETGRVLAAGGVLALPTETYYALGVSPQDGEAVARVQRIKGRAPESPILVLVGDPSQLAPLVRSTPPAAAVLIQRFWPGPLTLVLPAAATLPEALTVGTGTVGVRWLAWPAVAELLRAVGPLTGTSANRSGHPPARTAREVEAALGEELDLVLDGGPTPGGLPSTVVDVTGPIRLLREGRVSRAAVAGALAAAGLTLAA